MDPAAAGHVPGPERRQHRGAGDRRRAGRARGPAPHGAVVRAGVLRDRRARGPVRRAAHHPDRRRGHAYCHFHPELLRRSLSRRDGLRAQQQAARHRRRAGRLERLDPVDHHVPGDEPVVHQRVVRGVRHRAEDDGGRGAESVEAGDDRGRGPAARAGEPRGDHSWVRHGGSAGPAESARAVRSVDQAGYHGQVRHSPGRGTHAGPHECVARGSEHPLHRAGRDGGDQSRHATVRRGACDRGERRRESGRPLRQRQSHLRHADHRCGQGQDRPRHQAEQEARLCRHRQRAIRAGQHLDAVRRRQGGDRRSGQAARGRWRPALGALDARGVVLHVRAPPGRSRYPMRFTPLAALAVIVAFSTCTPSDSGRVAAPRIAAAHDADFTGAPDLIVDGKALEGSWVVYDQILKEGTCTLEEGGVLDPTVSHRVVRFTVNTPNIGDADIALGDPAVHVAAGDGLYQLSTCHQHWHFQHYATYELVDPNTGTVWLAAKRGFCMIDVVPWNGNIQSPGPWVYRVCGRPAGPAGPAIAGNQGISHGWADQYYKHLGGQYFVLDGGDGQPPVPPGNYVIRIHVNPPFACTDFDRAHNRPVDPQGFCHNFAERTYDNNVAEVPRSEEHT